MKITKKDGAVFLEAPSNVVNEQGHSYQRNTTEVIVRIPLWWLKDEEETEFTVPLIQGIGVCRYCGDVPTKMTLRRQKGKEPHLSANTECEMEAGFLTETTINISDGVLVVTDNFCFADPALEEKDMNWSTESWVDARKYSEWLETHNVAYSQLGDGEFYVCEDARTGDILIVDLDHKETKKGKWKPQPPKEWKILGSVLLERFAAHLTSQETYDTVNKHEAPAVCKVVVDVEPGEYVYSNRTTLAEHRLHWGQMVHGVLRKKEGN